VNEIEIARGKERRRVKRRRHIKREREEEYKDATTMAVPWLLLVVNLVEEVV